MPRGKCIRFYLIDGDVNGRTKCTLSNWIGTVFKIPRTALDLCKDRDELKFTGVYLLFGKDDLSEKSLVYVGQAGARKNGEGILKRLSEHNNPNTGKDYWTEAIVITTSNNSLGPTDISYLEHRLFHLAKDANRYDVRNDNDPSPGNPSEEKQSELEEFIDYAKVIVGSLGHKVFEPLVADICSNFTGCESEFLCNRNGADAHAIRTSDGFVVKKGSRIARTTTPSCPEFSLKKREQYKIKIDDDFVLLEDILFNSPSGAACFVLGSSANGYSEWKNSEGKTLKEIESMAG